MVLLIDQQGQPGCQGFLVAIHIGFPNCRTYVLPPSAGGMNHGTDARLPDGSSAMSM